jgi:CRP-like cAMP-binding protein
LPDYINIKMKEIKALCNLEDCFLCTYCIKDWLPAIGTNRKNFQVKKGQKIFNEGDKVTGIYFVYSGTVKVHKRWDADKELILRFAKKGDILGHLGLGDNTAYPVTTTALEECVVCYIEMAFFESTINVNPKFTYALLKFFANELQESEKRASTLIHMPAKERIALALLNLKKQFGVDEEAVIAIDLTRQDLAAYAAVSYETLFKVIQEFLQLNIVQLRGKSFKLVTEAALLSMTVNKG